MVTRDLMVPVKLTYGMHAAAWRLLVRFGRPEERTRPPTHTHPPIPTRPYPYPPTRMQRKAVWATEVIV